MDASRFDAWTRRRFGLTAGGALASLFALQRLDEADAKNKKARRRRKRKKRQKRRERRRNNNGGSGPPVDHPDVLVIYVDDMREEDFAALSRTQSLIGDQGATYPNFFLTTPLCSPSRASFFRGQYAHNTGVHTNGQGGYGNFVGIHESTIATWLREANPSYHTAHVGKHMNGYKKGGAVGPGWSDWIVPAPVDFYNYDLNVNGTTEKHGKLPEDYLTDVLAEKARGIITSTPAETPLFLYFAPKAPHGPSKPADRHEGAFADAVLDKGGSFNEEAPAEIMEDKPAYMQRPPLSQADIDALERSNQHRLESLLAVDEAIESLIETFDAVGRLDRTYIFFATDNGYLLGQHRRRGKNVPYEEAIRMSMLVRGPGIRGGQTNDVMVANVDLAPTIAELAGVEPPSYVDGRSIVTTFDGSGNSRQALLIETYPEAEEVDPEEAEITDEALLMEEQVEADTARRAIRTEDWLYVEIAGTNERELYDLSDDPFQLDSLHLEPEQSDTIQELSAWLATLRDCDAAGCRDAEDNPPN